MADVDQPAEIIKDLKQLVSHYLDMRQAGATSQVLGQLLAHIFAVLLSIGQSPATSEVLGRLLQIGADQLQSALDEARLNPAAAVEPTRQLVEVFDTYDASAQAIRGWARSMRFLPLPFRAPLEQRVPQAQLLRQVEYLRGLLHGATERLAVATISFLHTRDIRARLGATPGTLPAISAPDSGRLILFPEESWQSARERTLAIRRLLLQVAAELRTAAKDGRKHLRRAERDKTPGHSIRTETITATLAEVSNTLVHARLTYDTFVRLIKAPTPAERDTAHVASLQLWTGD